MSARLRLTFAAVVATSAFAFSAVPAYAHSDRGTTTTVPEAQSTPGMQPGMEDKADANSPTSDAGTEAPAERDGTSIELLAPARSTLGTTVQLKATLRSDEGNPIAGATVTFVSPASFGDEVSGDMVVGTARTDKSGVATVNVAMRRSADVRFTARFDGDRDRVPAKADMSISVADSGVQLYRPSVGIRVPGLGPWVLAVLVAGVWLLYLVAAGHVFGIARAPFAPALIAGAATTDLDRRRFLTRFAVPAGLASVIAPVGAGLAAVVARSPRTHTNLGGTKGVASYRRTPVDRLGAEAEMMPMPALLERPVSFEREVLPLLKMRAGPHATAPKNSSPPAHVQLDSYEHIMAKEGLVVPGKPDESTLVTVLLESAMRMPPVGPRLSPDEIQLIASWVAQGAKQV